MVLDHDLLEGFPFHYLLTVNIRCYYLIKYLVKCQSFCSLRESVILCQLVDTSLTVNSTSIIIQIISFLINYIASFRNHHSNACSILYHCISHTIPVHHIDYHIPFCAHSYYRAELLPDSL